jgi:hypothetical protein
VNDTLVMPHRSRIDRTDRVVAAVAVVVFALIVGFFTPVLDTPATIDHLTIKNNGTWPVTISIAGSDTNGFLPLGVASPGETTIPDVIDPGVVWRVRFTDGDAAYTERVNRSAVVAGQWTISVPSKIQDLITAAGVDPPAAQ